MRYQIMSEKTAGQGDFHQFFETEDLQEAKDFAMRLAFFSENKVYVFDAKVEERIRDFDDPKHW